MSSRARFAGTMIAALLLLAGCSADGASSGDQDLLPADAAGLIFLDCWGDTASILDPTTGLPGTAYRQFAEPTDSEVQVQSLCQNYYRAELSGIDGFSPDHTKLAATKRSADSAEHVGFIDTGTGAFTDISERLKLDANGRYTDEGSGLDDFAGPIKDRILGFSAAGDLYLDRAGTVHAAVGPEYTEFVKQVEGAVLGDVAIGGITQVAAGSVTTGSEGPLLQLPAGTPQIEPLEDAQESQGIDEAFAPLEFAADDEIGQDVRCDDVRWVDDQHLLCVGSSETPWIIDLSKVELVPAAEYGEDGEYCSNCVGWQYIWSIPTGSVWPLVPETSRELTRFTPVSSAGLVYFLADNGDTVILYSVSTKVGATPQKVSTFTPGESPSFTYLGLQWR